MTSRLKGVLFLLFLVSGFCGLLYQVVWIRMAFASFGVVTPVLSVIVSVFMFGLFAGSWAAGKWVGRMTDRTGISAIQFYALSEWLIAIGACVVPWMFAAGDRMMLRWGETNSYGYLGWSGLIIAVSIFPWCVFMGATFPLMTAFVKEQQQSNETSFSFLYLANVIGAMLGTLLSALLLIELLGFRNTLWVAAGCNVLIGLAAIAVGLAHPRPRLSSMVSDHHASPSPARAPAHPPAGAAWLLTLILFTTGFTSMAMEVVWTRQFTPVLRTQVYSFAMLLFVYLLATWIGSLVYRRHLRSARVWRTATLMGWLSLTSVLPLVINDPRVVSSWIAALSSICPFCALLGYLTPKLIDESSQGVPERVGSLYAVNIFGCMLGPLAASYLLLPFLGLKYVLLLLAAPYLGLLLVLLATSKLRLRAGLAPGLAAAGLFVVSAIVSRAFDDPSTGALIRRDHTATVLATTDADQRKQLWVNGVGMTGLLPVTKMMAHLPLAHVDDPKSALIICFGMGTTWRSAMSWKIDVTAAELVPSVKQVFPYYHKDARALLAMPNGKIVIDDGRRYLRRTNETFDVITVDPPPPVEAAGSSMLYSDEFYDAVKLRLKPNGILQQWMPTCEIDTMQAAARSLLRSFPYVRMFASNDVPGAHFLASTRPIRHLTAQQLAAKLPPAARADLVEWGVPTGFAQPLVTGTTSRGPPSNNAGKKIEPAEECFRGLLVREIDPREFVSGSEDQITDDRPYNEYFLIRRLISRFTAWYAS